MDHTLHTKHGHGFYIILSLFTLIYPLGVFFLLFAWLNVQSYDLLLWQPNTLLLYALAFLIGCVSIYGIWRKKKWGVYSLAGTWVFTGILNLVFVPSSPTPYTYTFLAVLLVIAFFLLLLPEWSRMK